VDEWKNKETSKRLKSCAMIITEPNDFVAEVHNRMPVLLESDQFEHWLSGDIGVEELRPAPNDYLARRAPDRNGRKARRRAWASIPRSANVSGPSDAPALMADGSSGDAHASDPRPAGSAGKSDLRDDAVLMNRRGCHRLRRGCDG